MSESNLKDKLLEDVLKTGFPLELDISNVFINRDWSVTNSAYYIDKDEHKGREIDIEAYKYLNEEILDSYLEVVFSFIIEVKQAKSKPWVIFTTDTASFLETLFPLNLVSTGFMNVNDKIYGILHQIGTKVNQRIGRSFYEGFSGNGGRDDIYKALSGTIKALAHFKENSVAHNDVEGRLLHYLEPVIVLEGKLFEAYINRDNEISLEESKYIQVNFEYLSPNYSNDEYKTRSIVHIVKREYLEEFIEEKEKILQNVYSRIKEEEFNA